MGCICTLVRDMASENKLRLVAEIITHMAEDTSVPQNIRRAVGDARESLLKEGDEPFVKVASAISILSEIINDPNMPVHARTTVRNALSTLETILT